MFRGGGGCRLDITTYTSDLQGRAVRPRIYSVSGPCIIFRSELPIEKEKIRGNAAKLLCEVVWVP